VADAQSLDREAAGDLAATAKGILAFPDISRENCVFGVQSGNGALLIGAR
jgi:lipid-binding SYLF domain-containing protein